MPPRLLARHAVSGQTQNMLDKLYSIPPLSSFSWRCKSDSTETEIFTGPVHWHLIESAARLLTFFPDPRADDRISESNL